MKKSKDEEKLQRIKDKFEKGKRRDCERLKKPRAAGERLIAELIEGGL